MNDINLVNITKKRFQTLRDDGWEYLLDGVNLFYNEREIHISNMDDILFYGISKLKGNAQFITIENQYQIKLFYIILDI